MPTITCIGCGISVPDSARQRRRCATCRRLLHKRIKIRTLLAGEPFPDGEPKRYPSSHGYIRLRWKVAPWTYIETYEHRAISIPTAEEHVHHLNGIKSDNRPENLSNLSPTEHERRHHSRMNADEAIRLYESGLSCEAIGKQIGHDPSAIWRLLKRHNISTRSELRIAIPNRERRPH